MYPLYIFEGEIVYYEEVGNKKRSDRNFSVKF